MAEHILNRPIWNSLNTRHAPFAVGEDGARRFRENVSIFAGLKDESAESLSALARLMPKQGNLFLIQVAPIALPDGIRVAIAGEGYQMILENLNGPKTKVPQIERLTEADAEDMFALATLTKPGPY
ncbi:MAG: hypothetical protein P1U71_11370, partial [Sneathiella sp.]